MLMVKMKTSRAQTVKKFKHSISAVYNVLTPIIRNTGCVLHCALTTVCYPEIRKSHKSMCYIFLKKYFTAVSGYPTSELVY